VVIGVYNFIIVIVVTLYCSVSCISTTSTNTWCSIHHRSNRTEKPNTVL